MDSTSVIRRLHEHRVWVNENLLAAAALLTDRQLRQAFPIGQGSVFQSLLHMYGGEYVWLAALNGDDDPLLPGDLPGRLPGNQLGENPIDSLPALRKLWTQLNAQWQQYLQSLSPESLDELVYKRRSGSADGVRYATRHVDVLLHVCTHAHYTAAQVVNMLRHSGLEQLPETMLISLARQNALQ